MTKRDSTSRRDFLATAAAAGAISVLAGARRQDEKDADSLDRKEETKPTFPKLRVAFIGTGGICTSHIEKAQEFGVQCPVFCDVDTRMHENAGKVWPEARAYQDYREMFEREHANFDAVMVGTPDHHHYPATMLALMHGKHVYTQKPLTHTPWEARQLQHAAARAGVATQMGNQGHAGEGWRLLYEWVRSGALGDVVETHTWTDRPIWPQGMERGDDEDVPPRSLNWDAWCGPAALRPFRRDKYHRFNWRGWWDFGAGALGDMACHTMDGVFWALAPGAPLWVEPVASTPITADAFPKASIVRWRFPQREVRDAAGGPAWNAAGFDAYWYDGGLRPKFPDDLEAGRRFSDSGNLIIGTKASILISGDYGESPRIYPESKMKEIGKPAPILPRSDGHMLEWFRAAAGERPADSPVSNFAYAAPFSEVVLLGNVALRVGRRLEWDAANMKFPNFPDADQYVSKEYRDGWKF
ncbi:MAG: Gfo/Idh/MocA family oxidoreductase [Phycisphaerales bacterium]|nr:Gfo/Idh/MocA family oxidoreductase [Phycisphaerales bacterium]